MHRSFKSALVLSFFSLAACSHPAAPAPVTVTSAPLDPRAAFARGGEFRFVLAESPAVLDRVTADCAARADAAACVDRIAQAGAGEGWRVIPVDADHVRMQSFGSEDGREEIFMEAPCAVTAGDGQELLLRPTAPLTGTRLPPAERVKELRVALVDDDTLVMHDAKGSMTFRRARASR